MISFWHSSLKHFGSKSVITLSSLLFVWSLDLNNDGKLLAQITPDNSLGNEKSIVSPKEISGIDSDLIEGGAKRGTNLFHSFQDFNIREGRGAYFNNPSRIENILVRVTGRNESQILGTLGVIGGNANLFLLNPHGIIFGRNASLDVGGSFLATTADSVVFDNGFEFKATNPETLPLLTINVPIGLQFGSDPGTIVNRSQAEAENDLGFGFFEGIQVQPNRTLALVGSNLELEGGYITAEGRIELGSVGKNSLVKLNPIDSGWQLNYEGVLDFKNIELNQGAFVLNVNNKPTDEIKIQGKDIALTEGSQIVFVNQGVEPGGKLSIIASEALILKESTSLPSQLLTFSFGTGSAADIRIKTKILSLQDGAQINICPQSVPCSKAEGGNISIDASEKLEVVGVNVDKSLVSSINNIGNVGSSETINIETKRLVLQDGGQIVTSTEGLGQAGTIEINALESVDINGTNIDSSEEKVLSGLFARSQPKATGDAGNVVIKTDRLLVQNGAEISTATLSNGDGGNIIIDGAKSVEITGVSNDGNNNSRLTATTEEAKSGGNGGNIKIINTDRLVIEDGGRILTTTFGSGDGGKIEIDTSEAVEVKGTSGSFRSAINGGDVINIITGEIPTGNAGKLTISTKTFKILNGAEVGVSTFGKGQGGKLTVNAETIELSGIGNLNGENVASVLRSRTLGSGQAGDLKITTETLTIKDGAEIAVSSIASGNAGNLNIFASDILITENGAINVSATDQGEAGSLNIEAQDITLDNGSLKATTRRGDQGNISINKADTLLIRNNSEIKTDATESATGGNITINSTGIALLDNSEITATGQKGRGGNIEITTQRLFQEPNSIIDATSEENIDGTITINDPDVDPTSSIIKLPDVPIDSEAILAQDLCKFEDEKIAKGSSFIITGRGGLTPTSAEPLGNLDRVVRWANRDDIQVSQNGVVGVRQRSESDKSEPSYPVIQQSQGWVTTSDGSVWLIANAPETIPQNSGIVHPDCRAVPE